MINFKNNEYTGWHIPQLQRDEIKGNAYTCIHTYANIHIIYIYNYINRHAYTRTQEYNYTYT